jgi:hypothetical protein
VGDRRGVRAAAQYKAPGSCSGGVARQHRRLSRAHQRASKQARNHDPPRLGDCEPCLEHQSSHDRWQHPAGLDPNMHPAQRADQECEWKRGGAVSRRSAVELDVSVNLDTERPPHGRQGLDRLCRSGARGPVADCRLRRLEDGRYEYTPKRGSPFTLSAPALVKRLVALTPPPNAHLTTFHGVESSQRETAAPRHPPARGRAHSVGAPRLTFEEAEAPPRLGNAAPAHLPHRRVALPLRRPSPHPRRPLHPCRSRGQTRRARRRPAARAPQTPEGHRPARPSLRRLTDSLVVSPRHHASGLRPSRGASARTSRVETACPNPISRASAARSPLAPHPGFVG